MAQNGWEDLPSISVTVNNPSVGTNGAAAPASSNEIGFIDGSGNLQGVSAANPLPVDIHLDTVVVSENLTEVNSQPVDVGIGASGAGTQRVAVSSDSSMSISGNVTVVQPTGSNLHVQIDAGSATIGKVDQGAGGASAWKVDGSAVTQPVSAVSLPLPAGAATSANQTNKAQYTHITDGTNDALVSSAGGLIVSGLTAVGAAPLNNPVSVSGIDGGGLKRALLTDTTGAQVVVGAGVSGTPAGGVVSVQGVSGGQAMPVTTPANVAPATQNITIVDSGSTTTAQANGQNAITGSPTANSAASFSVSSEESVETQVTGTWTGTLASEVSYDGGTTWFTRGLKQSGSSYVSSSFTQNFQGGGSVAGVTNYRIRATAAMTGTAIVKIIMSMNQASIVVSNPQLLRDGTTQSILNTIKAASTAAVATDTALVVAISPNNNIPVSPPAAATQQAFSFTSATSQAYSCSQYSTLSISITSIGSGNAWVYEATNDGAVTWNSILAWPLIGGTANTGGTATGTYMVNVSGFQQFRIRVISYSSGTIAGTMYELPAGQLTPMGQQIQQLSTPVALATENIQDLSVTGASAQTAVVANILTNPSGAIATDLTGYRSGSVQIVSTGTGGTFIFEGSNDNLSFVTVPVYNNLILTGTPITAVITATSSQIIYSFPMNFRYLRVRIATTITGGSIQAFSKFAQMNWTPTVTQVGNNTAANLLTTTTLSAGGVVASAFNNLVADVASAAIITTTTTAAITPTQGLAYTINIPVTIVSGTNPTLSVALQESSDNGNNWFTTYTFPTMTATGSYNSPMMIASGTRIRYVQTVAGTSPSFTRTINRVQSTTSAESLYRNLIDTSINTTSTNSTTAILGVENTNTYTAIVSQGAGGSAVLFAMDISDDNVNWILAVASVYGVVGGATPVLMTYSGSAARFMRVRVVTGVAATTISYISLVGAMGSGDGANIGTITNRSGTTSGTPSTSTQVAATNCCRRFFMIQNLDATNPIFINFTAAADTSNSIELLPYASYSMDGAFISSEAINVLSAGTSIKYLAKEA